MALVSRGVASTAGVDSSGGWRELSAGWVCIGVEGECAGSRCRAHCWVLRDRAVPGVGGVGVSRRRWRAGRVGCSGQGFGSVIHTVVVVVGLFCCGGGSGGWRGSRSVWLLVENCTVDASIAAWRVVPVER